MTKPWIVSVLPWKLDPSGISGVGYWTETPDWTTGMTFEPPSFCPIFINNTTTIETANKIITFICPTTVAAHP